MRLLSVLSILALVAVLAFGGSVGAANAQDCTLYTVRYGDTLFRIATRYGTTVSELQRLNGLGSSTRIYAGQSLCVTSGGGQQPGGTTYIVQRGDTLARIARRFGVSWQVVAQLNGLRNPNVIYAGQVLTIPDVTIQ